MAQPPQTTDDKIAYLARYTGRDERLIRAANLSEDRLDKVFNKAARHQKLDNYLYTPAMILAVGLLFASLLAPKDTVAERVTLAAFSLCAFVGMAGAHLLNYRKEARHIIDETARARVVELSERNGPQ